MLHVRLSNLLTNIAVAAVATGLCLFALELGLRVIDGYNLGHLSLQALPGPRKAAEVDATRYAQQIKIEPGFDLAWFHTSPPDYDRSPKYALPADWKEAYANYQPSSGEPTFVKGEFQFLYNRNWLVRACPTLQNNKVIKYYKKDPGFVYAFVSPDASDDPPYRVVPRGWDRGLDYYNNFGFRGPDIVPHKSARTIRIAFLGSSVTAGGWPFSYPEYVVHYLREWAAANRFDVDFDLVNGARVGSRSAIIAKIMRFEVASLHPDIVIYYEGGNELKAESILAEAPGVAPMGRGPLERYSALLRRVYQLTNPETAAEPPKPRHRLTFDLSQRDPDLDREDLPFRLHQQIADIADIADVTGHIGGTFFLASFVAIVQDGLQLDPARYKRIRAVLNGDYAPLTYREIRQALDFENLVFRKLADNDHYHFLDAARYYPQDPDLFGDFVHFSSPDSFRLMGWILAQQLASYLRVAIGSGVLPGHAYAPDPSETAWVDQVPVKFDLSKCGGP